MMAGGWCCSGAAAGLLRAGLDDAASALAVEGFALLWQGQPVEPEALLVDQPGRATSAVTALAAAGLAETDERGRLVGINGLTLRGTRHRFDHAGRSRHTWCALDSLGIPAVLGLDAVARTDCPTCGRALTVRIDSGRIAETDTLQWVPDPGTASHVLDDFCAVADLYCSRNHLDDNIDVARAPGRAVATADVTALARTAWAAIATVDLPAPKDPAGPVASGETASGRSHPATPL